MAIIIRAVMPAPLPPPVTVTERTGFVFTNFPAASCDKGNLVSEPFMHCVCAPDSAAAKTIVVLISSKFCLANIVAKQDSLFTLQK
jgi:hypothetical protein